MILWISFTSFACAAKVFDMTSNFARIQLWNPENENPHGTYTKKWWQLSFAVPIKHRAGLFYFFIGRGHSSNARHSSWDGDAQKLHYWQTLRNQCIACASSHPLPFLALPLSQLSLIMRYLIMWCKSLTLLMGRIYPFVGSFFSSKPCITFTREKTL